MGFDIFAVDKEGKVIAYHRAYMGGFRMMHEQGYDWFSLIDALDCYGGVSGNGNSKKISLINLEKALDVLLHHDTKGELADNHNEERDEFTYRKPIIKEFMEDCISWIKQNNETGIKIQFS